MRFSVHDGPGIRTTVFLKGCPLACRWCHNPESQSFHPQLIRMEERCLRCGECVPVCPERAAEGSMGVPAKCRACGACVEACVAGAREITGRRMSVAAVVAEVERDVVFYEESGGGVTVSGGEPLAQPEFTAALLAACRALGIHTALDTCGMASAETLLRAAANADLVLYDLKLLDPARHTEYTGVSNAPILRNLEALAAAGRNVTVRFPLIPSVNDGEDELAAMAAFLVRAGVRRLDLLPYHRIGADKYRRLGKPYTMEGVAEPTAAQVEAAAGRLRREGLTVRIGGSS